MKSGGLVSSFLTVATLLYFFEFCFPCTAEAIAQGQVQVPHPAWGKTLGRYARNCHLCFIFFSVKRAYLAPPAF